MFPTFSIPLFQSFPSFLPGGGVGKARYNRRGEEPTRTRISPPANEQVLAGGQPGGSEASLPVRSPELIKMLRREARGLRQASAFERRSLPARGVGGGRAESPAFLTPPAGIAPVSSVRRGCRGKRGEGRAPQPRRSSGAARTGLLLGGRGGAQLARSGFALRPSPSAASLAPRAGARGQGGHARLCSPPAGQPRRRQRRGGTRSLPLPPPEKRAGSGFLAGLLRDAGARTKGGSRPGWAAAARFSAPLQASGASSPASPDLPAALRPSPLKSCFS